jgi:hypothetical protein
LFAKTRGDIREEFVDPGSRFNPDISGVELNFSVPKVRTCFKDQSLSEKPREMHGLLPRKLRVDFNA